MTIEKYMRFALPADTVRVFATEGWEIHRSEREAKIYIYPTGYHSGALSLSPTYMAYLLLKSAPDFPPGLKEALNSFVHSNERLSGPTAVPYSEL